MNKTAIILFTGLFALTASEASADNTVFELSFSELIDMKIESAGKRLERIKDVPANVVIITRQDIERMGYSTLGEVFMNVPGLYHMDDYEDYHIGVRGNLGGSIAFLVNGILQHPTRIKGLTVPDRARMNVPVEAIDRIEIVRGPMSVIYGNNAFYGSVNIITNGLFKEDRGRVSATAGDHKTGRGFAGLSRTFENGYLSLNAAISETDGLGGDYADMMSATQLAYLHPQMHRSLDGHLDQTDGYFDFSGTLGDFHGDFRYSSKNYGIYALTPSFHEGSYIDLETIHYSLGYEKELSDSFQLNATIIYSTEEYDISLEAFTPTSTGYQHMESKRAEAEIILKYWHDESFSAIAGYRHQRIFDSKNNVQLLELGVSAFDAPEDIVSNELFIDMNYAFTDKLAGVAGVRWTEINEFEATERRNASDPSAVTNIDKFDTQSFFTPRLALIYSVNDNHTLKAIYGEATQDNADLSHDKPEEMTNTELIYSYQNSPMVASLAGFFNTTENLMRLTQRLNADTGVHETTVDNSGELETIGIELMVTYVPVETVRLDLSATWQQTDDRNNDIDPGYSPQFLATARASYKINNLTLGANISYVDDMKAGWQWKATATEGEWERIGDDVDAYFLTSINMRYDHPKSGLYVNFNIFNLLDEEIRYPANELVNFERGSFGPGRRFLLTLGIEF